jgi:hypothetical protein
VTGYGLFGREIGILFPTEEEFSLAFSFQTASGAHPTSYEMVTGGSFPEVNRREFEADHSPLSEELGKNAIVR